MEIPLTAAPARAMKPEDHETARPIYADEVVKHLEARGWAVHDLDVTEPTGGDYGRAMVAFRKEGEQRDLGVFFNTYPREAWKPLAGLRALTVDPGLPVELRQARGALVEDEDARLEDPVTSACRRSTRKRSGPSAGTSRRPGCKVSRYSQMTRESWSALQVHSAGAPSG